MRYKGKGVHGSLLKDTANTVGYEYHFAMSTQAAIRLINLKRQGFLKRQQESGRKEVGIDGERCL